jgi:hypothetical protein
MAKVEIPPFVREYIKKTMNNKALFQKAILDLLIMQCPSTMFGATTKKER